MSKPVSGIGSRAAARPSGLTVVGILAQDFGARRTELSRFDKRHCAAMLAVTRTPPWPHRNRGPRLAVLPVAVP